MNQWTSKRTVKENIELMEKCKLAVGPIQDVEQVYHDSQFGKKGARPMFVEMEHAVLGKIDITGPAIRMSDNSVKLRRRSPALGEHTEEILMEIGCTKSEIERIKMSK